MHTQNCSLQSAKFFDQNTQVGNYLKGHLSNSLHPQLLSTHTHPHSSHHRWREGEGGRVRENDKEGERGREREREGEGVKVEHCMILDPTHMYNIRPSPTVNMRSSQNIHSSIELLPSMIRDLIDLN